MQVLQKWVGKDTHLVKRVVRNIYGYAHLVATPKTSPLLSQFFEIPEGRFLLGLVYGNLRNIGNFYLPERRNISKVNIELFNEKAEILHCNFLSCEVERKLV